MLIKSGAAPKEQLAAFFANVEQELERVEFFRPAEKRETMLINLRNIFTRMQPTQQDIQTLHGVIMSIAEGRKGPARGGILDGDRGRQAARPHRRARRGARALGARAGARACAAPAAQSDRGRAHPMGGHDARPAVCRASRFKRQVPIGPHIADIVSFPFRAVIDILPADESAEARGPARPSVRGSPSGTTGWSRSRRTRSRPTRAASSTDWRIYLLGHHNGNAARLSL